MEARPPGNAIEILLVEDNPGDVRLTREAFRESKIANRLSVVTDGDEAMAFLRRRGVHADAPRPDLILLDLNLPRKNGREVLSEVKHDPELRSIPVVILTTSDAERDILETYDLHANCFLTKPDNFDRFLQVVRAVEQFWFTMAKLPRED